MQVQANETSLVPHTTDAPKRMRKMLQNGVKDI